MKKILIAFSMIIHCIAIAQSYELKDRHLINYFKLINQAENKIISNELAEANNLYKEAFKEFQYPHAKDLHNSMNVAVRVKDLKYAYTHYKSLKCLGKEFGKDFLIQNFKNSEPYTTKACQNTVDIQYKKDLDSLYGIVQYCIRVSKENDPAFKGECTQCDSVASGNLLKLIQKKGFPNEYNIGLDSADDMFYQKFYDIMGHQAIKNHYSGRKVNFSNEIVKALNEGKIRPDIAGQLLDLNNGTGNYSFFKIRQFIINNEITDCCYISESIMPDKRSELVNVRIKEINKNRHLIGLSTTDEELCKNIFFLTHKTYVFSVSLVEEYYFKNLKDEDQYKKYLLKINQ